MKPRKALNKAFLKVKPNRTEIEGFKANLIQLLDRTNDTESEEFHKNLVIDFLKKTYYDPNHFINTKGRNDLVIHNGDKAKSTVGVIIEAKKPTNRNEMVTTDKLNAKAFQELVLYYLRERITQNNLETKHLIITNINEWFIFDATTFDRLFAQNIKFVKQFQDFEGGRLADTKTDFFYKQIAKPFIADIKTEIEFTHFNLQDYQKPLRNEDKADDNKLIALFKLLSPEHLLKLPFTNDSNSLDKPFYSELLHIIGLAETKEGSKKLIERNKAGERHTGTILEDAIIQLDSLDKLSRLERPSQFGSTQQEKLFNVALELSITWINRVLFLKLLEAQLITYHKGDKSYSFLNLDKLKSYDDLNSLFFQVLARKYDERNEDVIKAFEKVPYLNSSLFEPTDIEQDTLFISNLRDDKSIPIITSTVLKDQNGKKRTGKLNTLEYLFEFLNSYDFSSEGSEEIQEENKSLINASVLGLIFEKINGYKDGSFFTPGFITMYMSRETIRKAVVQKFNETKNWKCKNLDDLYDKIEDRQEANEIVNNLKICDPAVGSGHFLVSALNEMIAVKNDLKILQDRDGKRLKEYQVEVVNDELIITDEESELFDYNPSSKESQRIQETLFHEKQTIIENCLFGVDINPNSVKICRLRLWIELLKNAYYKNATELETLPNIDINIKCGNSLVGRFDIDADLKQALKKSKWSIDSYRVAVDSYRNAQNKEQKREMERLIDDIKSDFRSEISLNDPKVKRLRKLSGELFQLSNQGQLFEMSKKEKTDWNKKVKKLTEQTNKLEAEIEEIKANKIFENAFEWRFEFPEVLNDEGDYIGFDAVIGNPPYLSYYSRQSKQDVDSKNLIDSLVKQYSFINNKSKLGRYNSLMFFLEKSLEIVKKNGVSTLIVDTNIHSNPSEDIRKYMLQNSSFIEIINDLSVFDGVASSQVILSYYNQSLKDNSTSIRQLIDGNFNTTSEISQDILVENNILKFDDNPLTQSILNKVNSHSKLCDLIPKNHIRTCINFGGKSDLFIRDNKVSPIDFPLIEGSSGVYNSYCKVDFERYVRYDTNLRDELNAGFKDEAHEKGLRTPKVIGLGNLEHFKSPKIFVRQSDSKITATFTDIECCGDYSLFVITSENLEVHNDVIHLFYVLGILNSKLITFFSINKDLIKNLNTGTPQLRLKGLRNIPCPKIEMTEQERFVTLVSELIKGELNNDQINSLKEEIDKLVYELFELNNEEIEFIEND